jgi:hypothetical protein
VGENPGIAVRQIRARDHSFELPHRHLEAEKTIQESMAVGKVNHKLQLAAKGPLEVYDFSGEYAQHFDWVSRGGDNRPENLQKIFDERDHHTFFKRLGEKIRQQGWRCYAYCLMSNHYHLLLIKTSEANLVRGMRRLNEVYLLLLNFSGQYFQQRLGLLQVFCLKPLGEPAIDLC